MVRGFLRSLNTAVFNQWAVPFCFVCGAENGIDYPYTTSIRITGLRIGEFNINDLSIRDPLVYRQIFACQSCDDEINRRSNPNNVVILSTDAHTFFL